MINILFLSLQDRLTFLPQLYEHFFLPKADKYTAFENKVRMFYPILLYPMKLKFPPKLEGQGGHGRETFKNVLLY